MDAQEHAKSFFAKIPALLTGLVFSSCLYGAEVDRYLGVKQLVFSGQFKRVDISVDSGSAVVIESVTNKAKLSFQQTGDLLSIKTADNQSNLKGSQVISGGITNIAVGKNATSTVSIGGTDLDAMNQQTIEEISVKVPKNTSVELQGSVANVRIGNTLGSLVLDIGGATNIDVGSVGDVSANLAGATSTHIAKVAGDLTVDIAGSGELSVGGGEIRLLNITTSGLGSVDVNAVADKATIAVTGAGTVKVKHVKTRPEISILGAGSVDVGGY